MSDYGSPSLQEILTRFENLRQAPTGDGKRMPHKPLLILIMLGRMQRGDFQAASFHEIRPLLEELLARFGPPSKPNALDPFWRLQNDRGNIWVVKDSRGARVAEQKDPPGILRLESTGATGEFSPNLLKAFRENPRYLAVLAARLLADHFPPSLHQDIAAAAGVDLLEEAIPEIAQPDVAGRDPGFRGRILTAYEYRCAITGWDLRMGHVSAGIEAAHIRWHTAGGPSDERNGLALNALHHKLFDLGVFTLSVDDQIPRILVSREANGGDAVREMLMRFHRQPIRPPQDPAYLPDQEFIRWHQREVFKGRERV